MKTENFSTNSRLKNWLSNHFPFLVEEETVQTRGVAWLFKENGKWVFLPRGTGAAHQYFNAFLFLRINLEFLLWVIFQYDFLMLVDGWWLFGYIFFLPATLLLFGTMPFAFFLHIRWLGKVWTYPEWVPYFGGMQEKQFLQAGGGWKNNGRFAVHFRMQNDASAAKGYHEGMPNNGQAVGFNYGAK